MLIKDIGILAGIDNCARTVRRGMEMKSFDTLNDAWLRVTDGRFDSWGMSADMPSIVDDEECISADGGCVMPSFCDSHTHIVYAGSREREFIDKINGLSYEEIARRGGGILNSADLLHSMSEDELFRQSMTRADEIMMMGTGCVEIKSGYGLNTADELKMLRVIARIAETSPMEVRATFLGAHAVSHEYSGRQDDYVDLICREMLPAVAAEGLAEFVDVFCDKGFFTVAQTGKILETAARYGMRPKIHANELAISGGVQVGLNHEAVSVDHLERIGEEEIALLAESKTVATMLPGASFFLGMPYGPARRAIDAGAAVALASDYNPGSSPSGDMRMVVSLACIKMKLIPAEALNAATINGAAAMGLSESFGSIAPGKAANFFITAAMPSLDFFPYAYSTPLIKHIYLRGREYRS